MKDEMIKTNEPVDNYKEHELHTHIDDNCSECYKERSCVQCGRIIPEGRYCSNECRKEYNADWEYDSSIGN